VTFVHLDIESFCHIDVRVVGAYRYVEHPSFELLMCGYAIDDEPVKMAVGPLEIYERVEPLLQLPDATFIAHNATFDRVAFSSHLGMPTGSYLDPGRWLDPSVLASCAGYPPSLDKLTKALKVTEKDSAGTRLINLFCKLNRKGERNGPDTHPEQWEEFVQYCANDVEAMRDALRLLPAQSPEERAVWIADQRINDRGVRLDMGMAKAAVAADAENKIQARQEVIELTGVENPGSVPQLLNWFNDRCLLVTDLTKDTVAELLDGHGGVDDTERRVLKLRQELALASAPAKFKAALAMSNTDLRMRGSARYYGAHTGRWSGRGIQLQNLPRLGLEAAWEVLAIMELMNGFGCSPQTLKALVRPMLLGPLTVVDWSAIEARVIAWLAEEQWVLDAFIGGRDIYVETAKRMGMDDPEGKGRQQGKSAVLGLGYGGGPNALTNVGAKGTDDELEALVKRWRRADPKIVQFWYDLWDAFVNGGECGRIKVKRSNGIRRIILPSGREIVYRGVVAKRVTRISKKGNEYPAWDVICRHPTGKMVQLWSGLVSENVTQAVARDLLARSLITLDLDGVPVVAHVHDEIIAEGNYLDEVTAAMLTNPEWADGLPLDAEGHVVDRYTKG
jgi:DNA polymerase